MSATPPGDWYPDPQGPPGQQRWWDGTAWTEHTRQGGARPATPETSATSRATSIQGWQFAALAGCAAMLIGPFGPWASALGGIVSRNGLDLVAEDAWLMIALAAGCGFLTYNWIKSGEPRDLTLSLSAAGVGGLAIYHYVDLVQNHDGLTVGWGLYASMIGAGLVIVTGVLGLTNQR